MPYNRSVSGGVFALNPDGSFAWNTSGGYNFRGSPQGWEVVFSAGRLFFATGHFRNGILLGPITAQLLAPAVLGEPPDALLRPFTL